MGILDQILKGAQQGSKMRAQAEARTPEYNANILKELLPEDAVDVGLSMLPFGKLAAKGGLALASMGYAPESEAGTLKGVLSLLKDPSLRKAAERLFEEAPGASAFTDSSLAKALGLGRKFSPMTSDEFHKATLLLDDPLSGEMGQIPGLRKASQRGQLENLPWMGLGRNGAPPGYIWVLDHDGRHRLQAISLEHGKDTKVPVMMFEQGANPPMGGKHTLLPQSAQMELKHRGMSSNPYDNLDEVYDMGLDIYPPITRDFQKLIGRK